MPAPPAMTPQLDSAPPPQGGVQAAAPPVTPATFNGMSPEGQGGPDMQVVALKLQLGQAISEGLEKLGQIDPSLGALSAQLMTQLRDGLRTSLQQGLATSEPAPAQSTFSGMSGMDAAAGMGR